MKVICMYLPQYHSFPENDEWWGKDYTEWVAVKRAKPLFKGHDQPRVPLGKDYYDLDKNGIATLFRQAELARKYGVYGFCIYQYYFNGKTLMEKPLRTLLDHPEIDINYNICWANETWTRTWYGLSDQVLIAQEYGDRSDWRKLFEHLLPFFRDRRYIKVGNRPVWQIYKTFDIPCFEDMARSFDEWAKDEGFDGVYIISGKTAAGSDNRSRFIDGYYFFEPGYTLKYGMGCAGKAAYNIGTLIRTARNDLIGKRAGYVLERSVSGRRILDSITSRQYAENEFPGILPDWDNTPRRDYKGLVYKGMNPQLFEEALRRLSDKVSGREVDFVYVNAWNEWGEGAYVEPDESRGYAYLEAIKRVTD
ncbi:MAG: glycoside hydrolase family 99-like domain-containing protein [Lachnospiraceae bacterium]|nr:glycoside hydrolase family 99-like domain-containing protein [Lachnospiraceae bacterium]